MKDPSDRIAEAIEVIAPLGVKFKNGLHAGYPHRHFMRFCMHPYLFSEPFIFGGNKALKKLGESHDMNKLVGDDIQSKGEQFQG